jgi:hypothetical protein
MEGVWHGGEEMAEETGQGGRMYRFRKGDLL